MSLFLLSVLSWLLLYAVYFLSPYFVLFIYFACFSQLISFLCNVFIFYSSLSIPLMAGVLDTTLCDKVNCQWLATGRWFSRGTLVFFTNKTDHHDIAEKMMTVALNTITLFLTIRLIHTLYICTLQSKTLHFNTSKQKLNQLYTYNVEYLEHV